MCIRDRGKAADQSQAPDRRYPADDGGQQNQLCQRNLCASARDLWPVSYTHLDVYKRQTQCFHAHSAKKSLKRQTRPPKTVYLSVSYTHLTVIVHQYQKCRRCKHLVGKRIDEFAESRDLIILSRNVTVLSLIHIYRTYYGSKNRNRYAP